MRERNAASPPAAAAASIDKLFVLFDIADTFAVDCQIALGAQTKDYEDAVMIETAKRIGADCIITRNLKDYTAVGIPVYSPADFLSRLTENE